MEETKNYSWQICQDVDTTNDFSKLHKEIVNMVLKFCRSHDVDVDCLVMCIDRMHESIPYESWQACTDSSLELRVDENDEKPYLWSI